MSTNCGRSHINATNSVGSYDYYNNHALLSGTDRFVYNKDYYMNIHSLKNVNYLLIRYR